MISFNKINSDEPEEFLYVKNFVVGRAGGVSATQAELLRKEFLENLQKFKKYKLIGPEAEEAIRAEQSKIEEEGGAGMMCRAEECRRRLLRVSSADVLAEGSVERVAEDVNEVKLEVYSRRIVSSGIGDKKEQSINVYSVKYKVLKNEKDNLRMQSLAGIILAKKISGIPVTNEEEDQVSGLKPLGRDNLDNLARSMILPGWGQHTKDHVEKAFIFYTITLFGVAKCYRDWLNYTRTSENYSFSVGNGYLIASQLSGGDFEYLPLYFVTLHPLNFKNQNLEAIKTVNQSFIGFGSIYILNLVDAYFSNRRYVIGKQDGLSFDFRVNPYNPSSILQSKEMSNNLYNGEYSFSVHYRF